MIFSGRRALPHQGELPFLRRSRRLDRIFKVAIVASTSLALAWMIFGTIPGRRLAEKVRSTMREGVRSILGIGIDRAEIEARQARSRQIGIDLTREALVGVAEKEGPTMREFLRVAGMAPDSAVIRWGNFDQTFALSSSVFEVDDSGRSYRLRPKTRSVWLVGLTIYKVFAMFEIPDTPEARRLGGAVGGRVVPESVQTTNSWGCRGPEPDLSAPVRGIVLGDSNMQGLLVGDDQTPPSRLEARLRERLGMPVSILNTGLLGYSPEQYYRSLVAYYDRFRPQFVVISLCANDFGDMNVEENWAESEYWLEAITQFCRTKNIEYLAVPLPVEPAMLGRRNLSVYPGKLTVIYQGSGLRYLDPMEEFTADLLDRRTSAMREGKPVPTYPHFNTQYDDHHLSPLGCDFWAQIVARRLRQIWLTENPSGNGPHPRPNSPPNLSTLTP